MYKRLKDLREDNDLKQIELAEILSCTQSAYSDYERGVLDPSTEVLCKLADYYQVSIDYLLGRTDNPKVNR